MYKSTNFSTVLRFLSILHLSFALICIGNAFGEESLDKQIKKITHQPHFKQAHWGALFVDAKTGDVVYEHAKDRLFAPASTTKLFSVACALETLGADFRFETPVVRRGEINEHGDLAGDLILVASGDLTLGGRTTPDGKIAFRDADHTYANGNPDAELTDTEPLAGLNELARQVAASGIKHVRGEVLIDDRAFDKAESSGSGPTHVSPICINDNVIDIVLTPKDVGQPAQFVSRPQSAAIHLESKVTTSEAGKAMHLQMKDVGHGRIHVSGTIPHGHKPVVRVHEVFDARLFARTLFIEALQHAGVVVDAPTLGEPASELPKASDVSSLPRVALLKSPPFFEEAKLILKVSHNLHASTLPLLVAHHHGQRTLSQGLKLQHDFLKKAGVDVDTISFGGGAGGAHADFVTPSATVQLLQHMATRPSFAAYKEALPRMGVDGTLVKILPESPARDKVIAKTGTLYWDNVMNGTTIITSKALAGYMTTASGRELIFAVFVNNGHIRDGITTKTFGIDLGKICEIVYSAE